ncbi:tetratricopeptide repeat protein [Pseudomonadota bacterium]
MNRKHLRIATIVFAMGGLSATLSACGVMQQSEILNGNFWTLGGGNTDNNEAELGLAELAKGDIVLAQTHFEKALKANPNDVHALYGLAVLYQNTGQATRSRQLYEQIVSMTPPPREEILIWADKQTQPIFEVAQVNLHLLANGQPAGLPGAPMPGVQPMSPQSMSPQVMSPQMQPGPQVSTWGQGIGQPTPPPAAPAPMFTDADLNIVDRFKTLRALLDQGLITQDEFVARRQTNVGALLPLSSAPPASGLDRPVPSVDQVTGRLRAIGRALEMRALSPAQHMAERTMILDALMPARPANVSLPALPPKGLMEAADLVRRLEMLKEADLITSDEYSKERAAIEATMQPPQASPSAASMQGAEPMAMDSGPQLSGFQPAVHLASYRKQGSADKGWAGLVKRYGSQLGGLEYRVERVDLGGGKGVFYRLKAGPLPSNAAAQDLCRKLKAKGQYCEPSTINFG